MITKEQVIEALKDNKEDIMTAQDWWVIRIYKRKDGKICISFEEDIADDGDVYLSKESAMSFIG